ncbi:MAG: cation:dicarboxylase symporter family transporter, partial [Oscillospiraceae bacterium]
MKDSLVVKLLLAVALGIGIGLVANKEVMVFLVTLRYVLGQIIYFCVPLIIIGFIAPSITKLKGSASRLLSVAIALAYVSSVLAATMSAAAGYLIIPHLNIQTAVEGLKELPGVFFNLDIPPLMSVMSALAFSLMLGLAVSWTKSEKLEGILDEFQNVILSIVTKIVIPLLPFFIGCTFSGFAYDGSITKQLPVFIVVILIVLVGHFVWMAVLYTVAGAYSGKNPSRVFRHYGPAYLTAVGTMSSAATLPVTLTCARKSDVLRPDIIDFSIPLFTNIHLCGSVLTEVFFVMTVSQILY